jgi:hypothetical protein
VGDWWEIIEKGLKASLDHSGNYWEPSQIRQQLNLGDWRLWLVASEEEVMGGAITEVLHTARGNYVNVPFGWSDDPRRDIHGDFFPFIEELAQKQGFIGVKFISSRSKETRVPARIC